METLSGKLRKHLTGEPADHRAIISAKDAESCGPPIKAADPRSKRWRAAWRLWTKHLARGAVSLHEGESASQIFQQAPPTPIKRLPHAK